MAENQSEVELVQVHVKIPVHIHRLFQYRKANTGKGLGEQFAEAILKEAETFAHEYEPTNYPPDGNR